MNKAKKIVVFWFSLISAIILLFITIDYVNAGGWHHNHNSDLTINNYVDSPEPASIETITSGINDRELSAGMAMAMASGGHQFDFSYQGWQGSVTYSLQTDEDEQTAYSGALAHNLEAMLNLNALAHITFTPEQNDLGSFVVIGTTFRF